MRILFLFIAFTLFAGSAHSQNTMASIIPKPVAISYREGTLVVKEKCNVSSNFPKADWQPLFRYFKEEMKTRFGITVTEVAFGKPADISFRMERMPTSGKPAYKLGVDEKGITITSNFSAPAFHAMQSIFQLFPLNGSREVPLVEIYDYARFSYRGMHLDVARHFFPVSFIKKYIDYLAFYKFNTFHWHLVDDQGWRVESRKYPELNKTGSWRNGTITGHYPGTGNDNRKYGGYYTKAEIREVIQYAQSRFIEVIPEIEMPGHASAAIAAYPWLSCYPGKPTQIPGDKISMKSREEQQKGRIKLVQETWGVFDDVFCAGNDSTFMFLENVIDEILPLFPSKFFHIGGDECPKTHWKTCPRCQQRMKENDLKNEHELQSWFVKKIEKHLAGKGKKMIGWDEILEGGLAPNAVVMSWRGEKGGIEAAKQGHEVIMTPGSPLYFDHSQSRNEDSITFGGYNPIQQVYAYDPIPKELSPDEAKLILGAQANVWTEYITNPQKVEYSIFPRIAALSEVLWTPEKNKSWEHFEIRLQNHFARYAQWNASFSKAYFDLDAKVMPSAKPGSVIWQLKKKSEFGIIRVSDSANAWTSESGTFDFTVTPEFSGRILEAGWVTPVAGKELGPDDYISSPVKQVFYFNKATGRKATLVTPPSPKYPGDGAFTLLNGVQNEKGLARRDEFLGFEGKDCEFIIDLGEKTTFYQVIVNSLTAKSSWIWPLKGARVWLSDDGTNYLDAGAIQQDNLPQMNRKTRLLAPDKEWSARYIKILVSNYGAIPEGFPGAGHGAWLFLDEIEVE